MRQSDSFKNLLLVLYLVDRGVPSSLLQPLKTQHILILSFLNRILKHEDLRDCDLIYTCTSQGRNCNFLQQHDVTHSLQYGLCCTAGAYPKNCCFTRQFLRCIYAHDVFLFQQHFRYFTTFPHSAKNILSSDSILHNVYSSQYYLHLPNN